MSKSKQKLANPSKPEKIKCPDRRKEHKTILSSFERRRGGDRRIAVRYFIITRPFEELPDH